LVSLLRAIAGSKCAKDTMVIVTYDEFGGQWDHVPPPGQGGAPGVHDQWGPGTRIPALIVSPFLRGNFVIDHTQYDTTSILATIEHRFRLAPLSFRDAQVNDLSSVFRAKQFGGEGSDDQQNERDAEALSPEMGRASILPSRRPGPGRPLGRAEVALR
jgi:phospholipase C